MFEHLTMVTSFGHRMQDTGLGKILKILRHLLVADVVAEKLVPVTLDHPRPLLHRLVRLG